MSEFPSDWRVLPLGVVAEVVGGGTPSRDVPAFWGNDHQWITPSEVVAKDGQGVERSKERISDLGLHSSGAKLHPPGTILMTSRASIGFAAIAKEEICTNQGFQSLRCGSELDNWFALHQIRHRRAELYQLAAGSTFLEVSGSNVRSFPFIVPPLPEQKKIAEILSGIDSTTDNLRSYLGKQEILRKSLISELIFINNSNLDGSCNTSKYCLGDISTRITDGTHQAVKASRQGTIPFLYVSCVKDGMIDWGKSAFISEEQYAIATQGRQPLPGDILYTAVGSYGNAAMVTTDHRFCFQRHIALIQLDREKSVPKFIELALSSDQTKRSVDLVVAGNAQPTLTLGELRKLQIPVPTPDTQRQICEIISPLERKISALESKINALRNLKHSVSSDLLSGRKRVSI